MRKLRRSTEINRKKRIATAAAIAVISAGLLVSGPVANVRADMSGLYGGAGMPAAEANASTINICDQELIHDDVIKVNITESGSYKLTGSNYIGGEYVDTTITVKSGAVVDLYLDGLEINNVHTTKPSTMSGFEDVVSADVFRIYGTANIHVKSNSTITAMQNIFIVEGVEGVVNFVESVDSATLTLKRPEVSNGWDLNMVSGSGEVHYKGANVTLINGATDIEYCKGKTYLDGNVAPTIGEGGTIEFDDICMTAYQVPGARSLHLINGKNLHDKYGDVIGCYSYGELPENGKIVQLVNLKKEEYEDERPTQYIPNIATRREVDLRVGSDGTLSDTYLPGYVDMYIESGDTVTCYTSIWGSVEGTTPAYSVTFVNKEDPSDTMGSYWVKNGDKVTLLEENGNYTYTYSDSPEGGNAVTADTTISADTTIYVTKTAKPKVTITVDGEERQIDHGATLASADLEGTYACKETKSIVDLATTTVTEPITLMSVDLDTEEKDGKTWFKISSAEELDKFAKLVTEYGITNANGYLTEDIQDYAGTMIGDFKTASNGAIDFENSNFFRGSFDGRNHTVTLRYTIDGKLAGLFGSVSAGAEIKNVRVSGEVHTTIDMPESFTGALVASVICQNGDAVTIDNCINDAVVDSPSSQSNSSFVGGLVGGKYVQLWTESGNAQMRLFITNCVNTGEVKSSIKSGVCIPSGIIGCCNDNAETLVSGCINYADTAITPGEAYYDSVKVKNSYSLKVVDYKLSGKKLERGTEVTKDQFASGEVTYLLNANGSTRTWYQNIGVAEYPKTKGDPVTETVYRGYESCEATASIYSNTEIAHKEQGHKAGTTYSYAGGKISAGCIYCQEDVSASITLPTEYLGEQTGAKANANSLWTALVCPDITFGYAAEKDGEYSSVLPTEEGQWYVRAYVGEQNIDIDGTYTIKKRPTTPVNPGGGSGTTGGGSGTTGGSGESGEPQNPSDDEKTSDKGGETGKDDKFGKDDKSGKDGEGAQSPAVEKKVEKLSKQYGEGVHVVGTTSMVAEAVSASKNGGVFVTASGDIAKSTFVSGKNGKTYFTNEAGKPVKSALVTDGKNTYCCGKSGAIICNKPVTLADGTRVLASETGVIITKKNAKVTVNGKTYLTTKGGILASKEIVKARNGKLYYANKKGEVVTNTFITIDGVKYKANKNGSLKKVK